MNTAFERFKALADTKKNVYDEDLIALVAQESTRGVRDRYELVVPERDVVEHGRAARDREAPHRRRGACSAHGDRRRHGRRLLSRRSRR